MGLGDGPPINGGVPPTRATASTPPQARDIHTVLFFQPKQFQPYLLVQRSIDPLYIHIYLYIYTFSEKVFLFHPKVYSLPHITAPLSELTQSTTDREGEQIGKGIMPPCKQRGYNATMRRKCGSPLTTIHFFLHVPNVPFPSDESLLFTY